ncbi:hypothetical protein F2Q68_00014761 [Brassica cretica]|uniref:BED-type domain-containing protein n=1 Tax=Brassica cretica TaxID=69181 RepID=A0A8S9HN16_BRACR|nr:hypothetical protein F2Q68_00014761 [Brassica cretica]
MDTQPEVPPAVMPLKRNSNDIGWEYGILCDAKNPDRVKCKFCSKEMSGGTFYHGDFEKQDKVVNDEFTAYKNKAGAFGRGLALRGLDCGSNESTDEPNFQAPSHENREDLDSDDEHDIAFDIEFESDNEQVMNVEELKPEEI